MFIVTCVWFSLRLALVGKFGGDTDNWMWPRHTGDFSVFRVYANADNKPAEYNADNKPYTPRYVAEVSMQGYQDKDYAMTIGFPGSTDRYLCSWGVQQRIENSNKPVSRCVASSRASGKRLCRLATRTYQICLQICGKFQLLEELDRYE